jgi:hypothetical protein
MGTPDAWKRGRIGWVSHDGSTGIGTKWAFATVGHPLRGVMGRTLFLSFLFYLPIFLLIPAKAGGAGTMGDFTFTLSAYVGSAKKCDSHGGGGPKSCCGHGSPQQWATKDGKSQGGQVGIAVGSSMRKYMGCKVTIPGYGDFRIRDFCPECDGLKRLDISFSDQACATANSFKKPNISGIKVHTDDCQKGSRGTASAKRKKKN